MKTSKKRNNYRMIQTVTGGFLLAGLIANAHAGAIADLTGYDINESSWFKNNNLQFGGWVSAGVTYNATGSDNKFNGPVTFGDRHSEVQLNQLNLYLQKVVATEGNDWDFGGRFEIMFGSDAVFTQAYGAQKGHWDLNLLNGPDNRFYDLAMPQAYLETYVPLFAGKGVNVKAGHFYTPIGYETVPEPEGPSTDKSRIRHFFYTHSYTMQFGEPFTHTGIQLDYKVDDNWAVVGGALTGSETGGWDGGFDKQLGNWGGLLGATWTSNDQNTSFNATGTYGEVSETNSGAFALYSLVFKHNITDDWRFVMQHDHGFANNVATVSGSAEWYGVNSYITYDIQDNLDIGLRAEWFRDQDGYRVYSPARPNAGGLTNPGSYYEITAGLSWEPLPWLDVRPNVRYDWVDGTDANGGQYRPFGNSKQDQLLFSTDVSVTF